MKRTQIRKIFAAICLLFGLFTVASAQTTPACVAETEKLLFEAEISTKYDSALKAAEECSNKNPKSAEAKIVLSKALAYNYKYDAAMYAALTAIELAPQSSDAFYARGLVYELKFRDGLDPKDKVSAIADYTKALELNPRNGVALYSKTYMRKLSIKPTEFSTLLQEFTNAIEYLKANGNSVYLARAYFFRSDTHISLKQWNEAVSDLTMALKTRPNYLAAFNRRAEIFVNRTDKTDLEAAIADYTESLKIKPEANIYAKRAVIYEKKGETAKAVSDWRAALALDPFDTTAKAQIAKLAPAATTASSNQTPTNSPKQPTAEQFAAEGRSQAAKKDYDGAIKSFSECLRLKPDAAACYSFRGFARGMKGDLASAKTDFEAAIKLEPNQAAHYFIRGMMYSELGKKDEAISDFRAALKLDPNNQQAKAALQKLGVQP
ncbi:MAG: tetratricopeptide repeat protein [Pyrinomonadaceae bacterium]|nr:tetratricopeptide repeat protein [Pyrinomonadaceae bacterium]